MDQLSRERRLLRPDLQHRERLLVPPGCPPPAPDPVPLQRCSARRRGEVPLSPGRRQRRRLVPDVAADPERAQGLRVPPRARVHDHHVAPDGDPIGDGLCRATGRDARALADHADERPVERRRDLAVRGGRVLPLGCAGRRHELPAQLVDRRGRSRGRRRLPQDGVPRAARPLRVLRQLRAVRRIRDVKGGVPGTVSRLGPAPGRRGGPPGRNHRQRLAADRRASRQAPARAGRESRGHVRPRLCRESRRLEVRPAGLPDDRQAAGPDGPHQDVRARRRRRGRSARCASSGRPSSPASR